VQDYFVVVLGGDPDGDVVSGVGFNDTFKVGAEVSQGGGLEKGPFQAFSAPWFHASLAPCYVRTIMGTTS